MPKAKVGDGTGIYYELGGEGSEFIVFISGTGFSSQVWKPFQVPYFSSKFKILISDHRGVGFSDKPDEPYETRTFARDIVGLFDELGIERAHVVGHSMGGRVAQWIALEFPRRVSKLVLAATGSGNFSNNPQYIRGVPLDTALEIAERGYDAYIQSHVESEFFFTPNFAKRDPERYRVAVDCHLSNIPPLKMYLRHVVARQMHETSSKVCEIKHDTLVLAGDSDISVHGTGNHLAASEFLNRQIKNSSLELVKGANHAFFWEKSEESNRLVENFLLV